jgi:hypothetical protein
LQAAKANGTIIPVSYAREAWLAMMEIKPVGPNRWILHVQQRLKHITFNLIWELTRLCQAEVWLLGNLGLYVSHCQVTA